MMAAYLLAAFALGVLAGLLLGPSTPTADAAERWLAERAREKERS